MMTLLMRGLPLISARHSPQSRPARRRSDSGAASLTRRWAVTGLGVEPLASFGACHWLLNLNLIAPRRFLYF